LIWVPWLMPWNENFAAQKIAGRNVNGKEGSSAASAHSSRCQTVAGQICIIHIENDNHNEGMLMAYIPKEKVLVEADDFTPPAPNGPAPAPRAVNFTKNLNANIERLNLMIHATCSQHQGRATTALASVNPTYRQRSWLGECQTATSGGPY